MTSPALDAFLDSLHRPPETREQAEWLDMDALGALEVGELEIAKHALLKAMPVT